MYTDCEIIITQRKNKGKMCGEVNKQCRHNNNICDVCNRSYRSATSMYNHKRSCHNTDKIKPIIKRKDDPDEELKQKVASLEDDVVKLKNMIDHQGHKGQNVTINNNCDVINGNVININITVGGPESYMALIDKLGKHEAFNFIIESYPAKIMEKLYYTQNPLECPIANKDGNIFRYRDTEHRIIHDDGGSRMAKLSENITTNLKLEATNNQILQIINNGSGSLPQPIKVREVQDEKKHIDELACVFFNPHHPFFAKGTQVIVD